MRFGNLIPALWACVVLSGCGGGDPVTAVDGSEGPLVIYPDYKEVTIPSNIAPLNFRYAMENVRKAKTTFTLGGKSVTIRGGRRRPSPWAASPSRSGATKWNGTSAPGRNSLKGLRDRRLP